MNTSAQDELANLQQASIDQINSFVIAGSQQDPDNVFWITPNYM